MADYKSVYKYRAFISYSWADAAWGKWLHHALETYRTPAALVGSDGAHGPVPARLHPLFKDREEQAAGASISASLDAALADSEFLIVICSPRSAASQWVGHEIAWFKANRNPANILAVIVDGEPSECFPPALTHKVGADLVVSDEAQEMPLAADARDSGDGKRRAKLKLAAAMLGVGLDELVNRDERRRALRTRLVVGASLAFAVVMGGMAWVAVQARDEARHQRSEADGLVEFMLTDLREKLEPVGRLDALDVVGQRALKYYAGQRPSSLDADALGRRSRALHLVGEVRNIRGDSVGGLAAFRQAAATTAELLARDPDNQQRIFDHAQSVFWVGYIAYERGETKEAEAQFREYKRLADRLVALNPKKPEWQMEVSYAETNLGVLFYDEGRYAEAEPAFAKALANVEAVASREKFDPARQLEIGAAINWLGKSRSALNQTAEALALHQREISVYQGVLKTEPANTQAKMRMAVAWQHQGQLKEIEGQPAAGSAAYDASLSIIKQLRAIEPENTEWQEIELRAMIAQMSNSIYQSKLASALSIYSSAQISINNLIASDPKNMVWSSLLRATLDVQRARLALEQDNPSLTIILTREIADQLALAKGLEGPDLARLNAECALLTGDALLKIGRRSEAQKIWKAALQELPEDIIDVQSKIERSRYMLFKRLGMMTNASRAASQLDRQGYRHPAYLREK